MRSVGTFTASIYVSFHSPSWTASLGDARRLIQKYVDDVKVGVSLSPTEFIYPGGNETGFVAGLINYPRFPREKEEIRRMALELAELLRDGLGQERVSVVMPDETVMVGE